MAVVLTRMRLTGSHPTPSGLAMAETRIESVMAVMPAGMIAVEVGIKPRVVPHMTVEAPSIPI